jgi:membrane associated rhomboid family serine protease
LPIIVPAIVALNVLVFTAMLFASGSFSDPATLVSWGATFGPATSNGEWWRLATSLFVHAGMLHVIVTMAGLAQVGITLERMHGSLAVATVYASAGLCAGLERLSGYPMDVNAGASCAVLGIYGLLIATLLWNVLERRQPAAVDESSALRDPLNLRGTAAPIEQEIAAEGNASAEPIDAQPETAMIPAKTLARMAPAGAIFLLYTLAGGLGTPELAGLLTGFVCGLVFARRSSNRTTPVLQVASAVGVAAIVIIASAAMLRGIADVRPEIARVVQIEDRTAGTYEKAVVQFKSGALTAQALEKVITQKIVPELQQAHARLKAVNGVPAEHRPLVANAEEYFRLRDESWRLRADALRKSNMIALRAADRSERASLEALERIRPTDAK